MKSLLMMSSSDRNLLLLSQLAFYPMHWHVFRFLCTDYRVQGTVIARVPASLPSVHQQLGWVDPRTATVDFPVNIRYMPEGNRLSKVRWLYQELRTIQPDVIWVQEEPTDPYLLEILALYLVKRRPRIVTSVCENIFSRGSWLRYLTRRLLWSRLDGLLAVATPSLEGIRAAGMPSQIPAATLVASALSPPDKVEPLPCPFPKTEGDFVVGFAGRICQEKGWKVLLTALMSLPQSFKCLLAGDGPQVEELKEWLIRPALQDRAFYVGLLPKDVLWRFYAALDCLVLPSLTLPGWKEQFGGVLADGMAMGLPLIGSDSGAIPEVIGPAGLVVPEGDAETLAAAVQHLDQDPRLRNCLSIAGRRRFDEEFAIPAYGRKIASALGLAPR